MADIAEAWSASTSNAPCLTGTVRNVTTQSLHAMARMVHELQSIIMVHTLGDTPDMTHERGRPTLSVA